MTTVSIAGISNLELSAVVEEGKVEIKLAMPGMTDFTSGTYVWRAVIDQVKVCGLKAPSVDLLEKNTIIITGKLGPLSVEQKWVILDKESTFIEVITIKNQTEKVVKIDDLRTGFSLCVNPASDKYRLIAVPYRFQADGKMYDYSLADVMSITSDPDVQINATCEPAWSPAAPLVCERKRRFRSEGWILTNGSTSLLMLKYNNKAVEHCAVNWDNDTQSLVFGGSAFVLHKEPVQANCLKPGETFTFGQTRYEFYDGDWPEGYERFKKFMNAQGHGLTGDYQPQVHWNVLFDLGGAHWSRKDMFEQAALAKEIGCTRLYLDPGWQIWTGEYGELPLHGSAIWDENRLGKLDETVKELHDNYGLEVGLWSASRVNPTLDAQWPAEYFRKSPTNTPQNLMVPAIRQGHRNLALLIGAKANASSALKGWEIHQIKHLNDGWYSNNASWLAEKMPAWAEIDIGQIYTVSKVCLGNDYTLKFPGQAASKLRILVATEYDPDSNANTWQTVVDYEGKGIIGNKEFVFDPIQARYVRVEVFQCELDQLVRFDEIEIYEAETPYENDLLSVGIQIKRGPRPLGSTMNELCLTNSKWHEEKIRRLSEISKAGIKFWMFDFHGWLGPCYADDHGHQVPSTTTEHINSIYGISREIKKRFPDIHIEMHDAIWPWGSRYLPSYYHQGITGGDYDENWAYEFMWNTIEDIRSKRALCLYYYNLAYDIPLYLHINMKGDNDRCLAFWWMASTVRHLGIGGKTGAAKIEPHGKLPEVDDEKRFAAYKKAMKTYNRLKKYFTHGQFIGINGDETLHLHTLRNKPGGVLMVFNLDTKHIKRTIRVPLKKLNLKHLTLPPKIVGATAHIADDELVIDIELGPETPAIVEIGNVSD